MKRFLPVFPIWIAIFACLLSSTQAAKEEGPIPGSTLITDVSVTLRDGVNLATDIWLPEGEGPFPVILWRNPYNKAGSTMGAKRFVENGFAIVSQDTRGKFKSEGVWDAFRFEVNDGHDTLKWVAEQDWCNGKIGLAGGSYLGFTQTMAAASSCESLASMSPVVPWGDTYHHCLYWGGAFRLQLAFSWGSLQHLAKVKKPAPNFVDGKLFARLPLKDWDECLDAGEIGYLRDWVAHPTYDDYWKDHQIGDAIEDVNIPALYIGGWYDIFQNGVIDYWNGARTRAKSKEAREGQHLVMGPWTHGVSPKTGQVGELNFGEHSDIGLGEMQMNWYRETLLGEDHGFTDFPPLRLYVMGANVWRDEQEWPLARAIYKPLFLGNSGRPANSLEGDGSLVWNVTGGEKTDTYVYDPENPTPTHGGALLWPTAGPRDQTVVEQREDVLVYTSEVLTETVEVTGEVRLKLYAASTATDTDFTGKLVDVYPAGVGGEVGDGTPYNITEGILRARFRESDTETSLIEPGKPYEYIISLGYTSNAFLPGHRIRLEVSSSNFPRFDRNPNTGHKFGADAKLVSATQTVFHGGGLASHLILPIIPN